MFSVLTNIFFQIIPAFVIKLQGTVSRRLKEEFNARKIQIQANKQSQSGREGQISLGPRLLISDEESGGEPRDPLEQTTDQPLCSSSEMTALIKF